ncbi:DMT family transporter [Proteinivorax hydrogeniformans]|uniref:DMT family transporter n=1 Tax=Proteinivorax hydrogeniformans TaxID=1826727 RepID=A0AAU8HT86_9FIRM
MLGILYSMMAGVFISVQSAFNANVSTKVGGVETTAIVHGVGFIASLILLSFWREGDVSKIGEVNKLYLLGGVLGVGIVFSAMKGVSLLGAAFSISILLVAQLLVAVLIDTFGLFGMDKVALTVNKPIGILIMIIGVLIFQSK